MRKFFTNGCLFLILLVTFGCAKEESNTSSTLVIKMPDRLQQKSGQVTGFSAKACFAVNITATDITSTAANSCDQSYGNFAGLVPAGGTISLDTKLGTNRKIEIYYIISENGCTPFLVKNGLGQTFGSNNVHLISKKSGINFNQPKVSVEMPIEWPSQSNSLATILSAPTTCLKDETGPDPMAIKQARVVQGAARGTTANGSIIQIKILDQKLDMNPPNNWSGRILPNRLGEEL